MTTRTDGVDGKPLEDYGSVRQWYLSFQQFWRSSPPPPDALEALRRFLDFSQATPDEIVDEILRADPSGDGLQLRVRARRKYIDLVEQFECDVSSRETANWVRSFLIHNGVAMSPGILQ